MSASAAKSTKNPNLAKGPENLTKAAEAKAAAVAQDRFIYTGPAKEGAKKLAPQAQTILNGIEAAGKKGITRQDLIAALDGVLTTKQPLGRIVSYYQKELLATGQVELQAGKPE